jgi:hypothetical protein
MKLSSLAVELPLELERHIFEICALSRPVGIPKLMLVGWRVKEWCVILGRVRRECPLKRM